MAYSSESLKIIPISQNSFIHVSYLEVPKYGKVACNGLIYLNENKAVVFDTPPDSDSSFELIKWIIEEKKHDVIAVMINHFHDDCLGGLEVFHELGIPSFAHNQTIALAEKNQVIVPQIGFDDEMQLDVGNQKIINRYFGEGHTSDNIVSYIPNEKVLFGGCVIKSLNASKGNVADANLNEWSKTVLKIKKAYPQLKIVVPGHGNYGYTELLNYTIQLFSKN